MKYFIIFLDNTHDAEFTAQQRKILKLDYTLPLNETTENTPLLVNTTNNKSKNICCIIL